MEKRSGKVPFTFLLATLAIHYLCAANAQVPANEVTGFNLNPPYFNLAEGSKITATATCGEDDKGRPKTELYCKLVGGPTAGQSSQTIQGQYCDYCNSNDANRAHPASNAIDGTERWWQSPPLSRGLKYNEVNVTLDLGQLFHVAYVLIKFANSPRPDLWVLERSVDYGTTYIPWQYFAHLKRDCIERFGKMPDGRIERDDDQICTTEYSRIVPLENGEIVVSLVNGRPGAKNFTYSPVLRDFTKATNIRLRFLRTNTLLAHLISKTQRDPTVTRRYYYSIKDISVGGRCMCHGHAQVCGARNPENPIRLQCDCQHNTCGESCDRCCPGFNQRAWRPATSDSANECQPCQCHSHATDCYYDPEVERMGASLNIYGRYEGGGVCINCQHNTAGVNCERCVVGFYRPYKVPWDSPTGCRPCRCNLSTTSGCEDGSGRCVCRPNLAGPNCERCADGYYGYPQCTRYPVYASTTKSPAGHIIDRCPTGYFGPPNCRPCQCHSPGVMDPICDGQTGLCTCLLEFQGPLCDSCAPGYFNYPNCQVCLCDLGGTLPSRCDTSGRCLCRPEVEGLQCERCRHGYHSFPRCEACRCDGAGVADRGCRPEGQCRCHGNYAGPRCDQCAPNYYGYPSCAPCQCTPDGAYHSTCDQVTGQCPCRLGVSGRRCDQCGLAGLIFPDCQGHDPPECQCDVKGTLSGVSECPQGHSECSCKPNVLSPSCRKCKVGYFLPQRRNYFGCRGCQCDVGGALGKVCGERSGQCQCRKHLEGRTCTEPESNFYIPDLHHLKYEAEDGSTPNGRPARFGYDPQEFPDFSWRGYATMSPAQTEIRVTMHVAETGPSVFRFVLRFVNPGAATVVGRVIAHKVRAGKGSEQSKEVLFPPSPQPTFLTVPGGGYAEPFPLTPGKWIIRIQAEGILLDYLVLLPSNYYEASILQETVTEPCVYTTTVENNNRNCLLYKHLLLDGFPSALASLGAPKGSSPHSRRPTASHPEMAFLSGRQDQLRLLLRVPESGQYALVLEYASEVDEAQNVDLQLGAPVQAQAKLNIYSCPYSFLCRSVALDQNNHVAFLELGHRSELLLETTMASFLLYKVYAIRKENFSMEYLEPKEMCVSIHGRFTQDSRFCVPSRYAVPPTALLLEARRQGWEAGSNPLPAGRREGVLLKSPQAEISFRSSVPAPGRYVFLVHYLQPEHPAFPVRVLVDGGRPWAGSINASFCPHVSGCREAVVAEQHVGLDVPRTDLSITVRVPPGKTLTLDYILVVPDSSYSPELVKETPLNKSTDFINQCGASSFYINPSSASQFCLDSARSLAMFGRHGALPCACHHTGSTNPTCDPMGGQCVCRPHVIGRECTRCATGYYGFPYCKRCECGQRLCDEVTGVCTCPPQTVRPTCDACTAQTFAYHPLLGCESCNCSLAGIKPGSGSDCHRTTGQCTCKPRISGRQCDRCAPGYYSFPECKPCKCHSDGVQPDICHSRTGQCLCKKNVVGASCDRCRVGSFHFEEASPSGCTSCFCFGVTEQCQGSEKRRQKFVDMQNWRLQTTDLQEVPSIFNPASSTVVADIQELSEEVDDLHWVAPPSYLGDRVSSYGGFLTYQIKTFGIPSEGMALLDRKPDVRLSGNQMTLVYLDPQIPSPDRLYHGRIQLLEGNFRHAGSNRPVSREELMMVLGNMDGLRIRALYFSQSQRLSLGQVGLEEANTTGGGAAASHVEVCVCPPEYRGDSCQRCIPGYYRERSGRYLGRCVPCSCNGLSDECEDFTGRCLNCQHNTAGDRCERCAEGYYGDAAQKTCHICPCPLTVTTNSFATGCRPSDGGFVCTCKPGYTGRQCERCAPGFYGDPMAFEGSCKPCNCNGNPGGCDPRTGVCKNTLEPKDTTDGQCRECDSCAQTLLSDLERMDEELMKLKAMLDKVNASSAALDKLKKLEDAITTTKNLLDKYNTTLKNQSSKVKQLAEDVHNFDDDINMLEEKANSSYLNGTKTLEIVEKTNQKAKDLLSEAQELLKKIRDLLNGSGEVNPTDLVKMLAEAERMVHEMEQRNCTGQLGAALKEKEEAETLLNYIKNNVTRQHEANKAAAERIARVLKDYEAKLQYLEEALQEASETVTKANNQNKLNSAAMEDILKRIEDLNKERAVVTDQIAMAKDQLRNTKDLLNMLQDSKTEYEKLAAPLDGAKTNLTERVNLISQAASKEDIVVRAEKHAELLNKLAMELEEAVRNASQSSGVRDAIDAIEAYKNITQAIREAEEAAQQAHTAADAALKDVQEQNLNGRAKILKDSSSALLNEAQDTEDDLQNISKVLDDQKKRLNQARKKKDAMTKDLLAAQDEMSKIKRDDIGDMIADAKAMAASANDTSNDVLNKLGDIQNDISKIKIPRPFDFNDTLNDVDRSVKNLTSAIPSLLDKISKVEELTSNLSISNVSEDIRRIKELIQLARDAANRVVVPMRFFGDGHVELREPSNLADLRAFTSMSLSLQRPISDRGDSRRRRQQPVDTGDMFVLYLGTKETTNDWIGMYLIGNQLFYSYQLNGEIYTKETLSITGSSPLESVFDRVDLNRMYEDVKVTLTKRYTSLNMSSPFSAMSFGNPAYNLLNVDPSDLVFYVGGFPKDFTPPDILNLPGYQGCIEFASFNERFISLYNFKNAVNVNKESPCRRRARSPVERYFEGTGYASVDTSDKTSGNLRLGQFVNSRSQNAQLMYLANEESYYSVSLEQGFVVFQGREGRKILSKRSSKTVVLDGEQEMLFILRSATASIIRVGSEVITEKLSPRGALTYYIGGVPIALRQRDNITAPPLKGCVTNVKVDGNSLPLSEEVGLSRGCPVDFLAIRNAELMTGGSLWAPLPGFELADGMTVSVGFQSTGGNGVILKKSQELDVIELSLFEGFVLLKFNQKQWKSSKMYNDGKWHYVTVQRQRNNMMLRVDEDDEGLPQGSGPSPTLEVGNDVTLGLGTFDGCLANLYTRRSDNRFKAEDLSSFSTKGDVLLDVCNDRPLLMLAEQKPGSTMMQQEVEDEVPSGCRPPLPVRNSYQLGGPISYMNYSLGPQVLQDSPFFSLDVRTRSPNGMLLYASASKGSPHLALYMSKGRIRLAVEGRHIFNREKFNNGKWHTVMFGWDERRLRLIVDGLHTKQVLLGPEERVPLLRAPVYLGSVPDLVPTDHQWKTLPRESVIGCVSNFKLNRQPMPEPVVNHGVAPCFDGPAEGGAYFSGQGSYIVIDDSFIVGLSFELVFEVRPKNLTGLLFFVGGSQGHHLSLFMKKGEVVVQVDNGSGPFSVSVTPQQALCDNMFHRIAVIKRNNVVQLDVDTEGQYAVGPSSSSFTNTSDPLYVGGVPETFFHSSLVRTPYVGCLQKVWINGKRITFDKVSKVSGPVNLRECPAG